MEKQKQNNKKKTALREKKRNAIKYFNWLTLHARRPTTAEI